MRGPVLQGGPTATLSDLEIVSTYYDVSSARLTQVGKTIRLHLETESLIGIGPGAWRGLFRVPEWADPGNLGLPNVDYEGGSVTVRINAGALQVRPDDASLPARTRLVLESGWAAPYLPWVANRIRGQAERESFS